MTDLDQVYFNIDWPRDRRWQMIGLGLNAVDWICQLPRYPSHNTKVQIDRLRKLGGGQVATASALCGRWGFSVRYIGRVGDDDIGRFSLHSLASEPMDISCVETIEGASSQFAIILVDRPTGERTILWDRDSRLNYGPGELKREWVIDAQILHLDGHDQGAAIQAARWARERGVKVCIDIDKAQPGVEALLRLIDFALPSVNFVQQFARRRSWRDCLLDVAEITPGFLAVTRGKEGCAAVWDGEIIEVPGFRVNAVDTSGAGDVFHGAFIYSLFQNWSVYRCLRFANVAGALACTRYGVRASIPALEDVLAKCGLPQNRVPQEV
ncbi:MAG: carbohydrate kinase family protein [Acidobacteriota bacterium]